MKKLLPILLFLVFTACSEECEYGGDPQRVDQLLEEIDQLEEERDAAPESQTHIYQGQIDHKQEQLNAEMARCV